MDSLLLHYLQNRPRCGARPAQGHAAKMGRSKQKAVRRRGRFLLRALAGLEKDAPQPGLTPSMDTAAVNPEIRKTTQEQPVNATHWPTRTMAPEAGISEASVRPIWKAHGLKTQLLLPIKHVL